MNKITLDDLVRIGNDDKMREYFDDVFDIDASDLISLKRKYHVSLLDLVVMKSICDCYKYIICDDSTISMQANIKRIVLETESGFIVSIE